MSTELYKPRITEFENEQQMYSMAEAFVIEEMLENIGEEGTFRLAVSGGSTPGPLYQLLGDNPSLPWEEVALYQTDERFVNPNHDESNQKLIRQSLGEDTINRLKEVYFFNTETTPEYGVRHYDEVIDSLDIPTFDLIILGIGEDGHIASLFPGGDYFAHQENHVLATNAGTGYTTKARLSLTLEAILAAKKILVLLKGENKAHVLTEMIAGEKLGQEFPAKFLLAHPNLSILSNLPQENEEDSYSRIG